MSLKVTQFLALQLTALALIPAGAHLFELPNKMTLAQEQYFIVQGIYYGWALFGIVLFPAVAVNFVLAMLLRRSGPAFRLALLSFLCLSASVVIFFVWTYPVNVATRDWTFTPDDWQALRTQWEYSHAVNAMVMFTAFCSAVLSVVMARKPGPTLSPAGQ